MPIEVELPDGSIAEFPDGTTPDIMRAAIQRKFPPQKPSFGNVQSQVSQYSQQPTGPLAPSMSARMQPDAPSLEEINAQSAAFRGSPQQAAGQQAFDARQAEIQKQDFNALPAPARFAIGAGSRVGAMGRGVGQLYQTLQGDPSQMIAAEEAARQNDQFMEGNKVAGAGKIAGEVGLLALPASKMGGVTQLGRATNAGLLGATAGGLQPVVEGESRAVNTALGGLLGAGGQFGADKLVTSAGNAAKAITPELRALYETAKAKGIQLTPAQLTDSEFLKRMAGMADRLPFSGAGKRNAQQQQAGNVSLAKLIGEDADTLNPEVMGKAADNIGTKFDQLFEGGTKFDKDFATELAAIKAEADATMDDTARRTIDHFVSRLKEQGDSWEMPGRMLQSLDQSARKAATGGGDRQQVAEAFREALHNNFERNAENATKAEWKQARKQWATLKTLEPLVARYPEGNVPMQQVLGAVNATGRGRTAMARGYAGELGELAKIGQRMKGPSSSGTAENLQAGGLGAGLFANPLATLGLLGTGNVAGKLLNSGLLSDFVMRKSAGTTRKALAPVVRRAGLLSVPAAVDSRRKTENPKR